MNVPDVLGPTGRDAAAPLARDGPDAIPAMGQRNFLQITVARRNEPVLALLSGASLIHLARGRPERGR